MGRAQPETQHRSKLDPACVAWRCRWPSCVLPRLTYRSKSSNDRKLNNMNTNINPWHNVSIGDEAPSTLQAIIEIPKGSRAKYELDKTTGMLRLDRVLFSSVFYPANYGFIPQTLGEDHDPLDILVLSQVDIRPLCIVRAKVIGVMRMVDQGEADDKIVAVAADDISVAGIDDIRQLGEHFHSELRHFFEEYKRLEDKAVLVEGLQDRVTAEDIIRKAISDYNSAFGGQ